MTHPNKTLLEALERIERHYKGAGFERLQAEVDSEDYPERFFLADSRTCDDLSAVCEFNTEDRPKDSGDPRQMSLAIAELVNAWPLIRTALSAAGEPEGELRTKLAEHIWGWRHPVQGQPDWIDVKDTPRGHKYLDVADAVLAFGPLTEVQPRGWLQTVAEIADRANVDSYQMDEEDIASLLTGIRLDLNYLIYQTTGELPVQAGQPPRTEEG